MQEKPKGETKPDQSADESTLAEDQTEHSYYYDDSHGYEEYDPDDGIDDEDASDD